MTDYDKIYTDLNNQGLGYSVGSAIANGDDFDSDIFELADELGAELIERNAELAIYQKPGSETLTLVGDAHGAWAVDFVPNCTKGVTY